MEASFRTPEPLAKEMSWKLLWAAGETSRAQCARLKVFMEGAQQNSVKKQIAHIMLPNSQSC